MLMVNEPLLQKYMRSVKRNIFFGFYELVEASALSYKNFFLECAQSLVVALRLFEKAEY